MRIFIVVLSVIFSTCLLKAEDISSYLGKTINDRQVQAMIEGMGDYVESFLPYQKVYKITSVEAGLELEFNPYFVLYKVSMYDSGYRYRSFKGPLPFNVEWGWDSTQVQELTDYLIFNKKNEFIKSYDGENYAADFYFRNNKLELIRMEADTMLLVEGSQRALQQDFGYRLYPTGKRISGNIMDGSGVMEWGNGNYRYEGEWSYGVPHGNGVYSDSAGNRYDGAFKLGFFWGEAIYTTPVSRYEGEFLLGKYHGNGKMLYSNGTSYTGAWFRGVMDGLGTFRFNEEYYYIGEMRDNAFNGKGVLYTKDGYIKGTFKSGKPHGYCVQFASQSGQMLKGNWVNGSKEGEFIKTIFGYDQKVIFKNDIEQVPKVDE